MGRTEEAFAQTGAVSEVDVMCHGLADNASE
jgi:hypothetical protein